MFRLAARVTPVRMLRPWSSPVITRKVLPIRGFASGGPAGPSPRRPEAEAPKLRYLALVALLGTAAFIVGLRYVDNKRPREISPEEYEQIKANAQKSQSRAFKKSDVFVVFVLGGPGSGKGTQCDNIVRDYDFVHLSAGDLLRAEQDRPGSEFGDMIRDYIKSGQIVPQEVTIALLKNAMQDAINTKNVHHFLIDGFPRKMDQAITFEDKVVPSQFTLFFECPEQVMLTRLLKRGETSGRADDNIESIRKRFRVFVDQSMPVVEYFDMAGKVERLHCDEPVETVYNQVRRALKDHGVAPKAAASTTSSPAASS